MELRRSDPIFEMDTPLLFAHRGGARESPESTKRAFRKAYDLGTDVLEFDVQLTKDRKIVVWHGPKLDNVKIEGLSDSGFVRTFKGKRKIWDFEWDELENTYVKGRDDECAQESSETNSRPDRPDTSPETSPHSSSWDPDRKLLLLEAFFDFLNGDLDPDGNTPLNIELKGQKSFFSRSLFLETVDGEENALLKRFKQILDQKGNGRKIVVASTCEEVLLQFDRINDGSSPYPTNISLAEQLDYTHLMPSTVVKMMAWAGRVFLKKKREHADFANKAFETSYALLTPDLVKEVRKKGGSIHVFLTAFWPSKGFDEKCEDVAKEAEKIEAILETGVDGIMTDCPCEVRKIMKKWKAKNP
jgi:glycerophosphoryl diester phosphodiesterase